MKKTIALAAGGTGGHMFPAQSLAEEMRRRSWSVLLLTDQRGQRYTDGFPADDIVELSAANPNVSGLGAKIAMARAMAKGTSQARAALKQHAPSVIVGFGGYPSAPGLLAAKSCGIPCAVHEQNAVLGRVNRRAAKGASLVAHGFERLDRFEGTKGQRVHTGNPVRDAVLAAAKPYDAPTNDGPLRVLIFGGSQGASLFSRVFPAALSRLPPAIRERLVVTQQVRDEEATTVAATYGKARITASTAPFFADLPQRMAASHLVISRAGASTVTELSVLARPSVLVPLGIAMDDHQRANAEVLADAGASRIILERDLTEAVAADALERLLGDPARLTSMASAAAGRVPDGAAARLADLCEGLLHGENA